MKKISELKPEAIKYSTEERWGVFVIERQFKDNENITEKVTQCVGIFDSPRESLFHYRRLVYGLKLRPTCH